MGRENERIRGKAFSLFAFLFGFLLAFSAAFFSFAAQPGPAITLEASYGYQNIAKPGRYLPVQVSLENASEEDFSGTLAILSMEAGDSGADDEEYGVFRYEYPLEVKAGEHILKEMSISSGSRAERMYVFLEDAFGTRIAEKKLKLNLDQESAGLYIGVLSDTPDRLLYFDKVSLSGGTLTTRVIPLLPETFPEDVRALDQFDLLLITNFDTAILSEAQAQALLSWVEKGGVLLIGTGGRGRAPLSAFWERMEVTNLTGPSLRLINMGVEYAKDGPQEAGMPLECTMFSLAGGMDILSSDEVSVISGVALEKGTVAVSVYDFADIEAFCGENPGYVSKLVAALMGAKRLTSLAGTLNAPVSGRFWSLQSIVNAPDIERFADIFLYSVLAVGYVLLAGPGLYFFLKKKQAGRFYGRCVLFCSLGACGLVFMAGLGTRFNGPFFSYACMRDASEGTVDETVIVDLRSPYHTACQAAVDASYTLYPLTEGLSSDTLKRRFTGEEEPAMTVRYGEDETRITADGASAFAGRCFILEKEEENEQGLGFIGNIQVSEEGVYGSITNRFDEPVEDAALLLYNQIICIGDMDAGETFLLDGSEAIYGINTFSFTAASVITGLAREEEAQPRAGALARQRATLLAFYMESMSQDTVNEARVVAFGQGDLTGIFTGETAYESYGNCLLTSAVTLAQEKDGEIFRFAFEREPNIISGDYNTLNNTMSGASATVLEYYLGNDIEVERVYFRQAGEDESGQLGLYYTQPFTGKMYFYNYDTGNYDYKPLSDMTMEKEELAAYLSPGNTLTVKYVVDTKGDYSWNILLPSLAVTGQVPD